MTDRDWIEVCLSGGELDEAGHIELERQLAESPDNLELRIKRLGFLYASFRIAAALRFIDADF